MADIDQQSAVSEPEATAAPTSIPIPNPAIDTTKPSADVHRAAIENHDDNNTPNSSSDASAGNDIGASTPSRHIPGLNCDLLMAIIAHHVAHQANAQDAQQDVRQAVPVLPSALTPHIQYAPCQPRNPTPRHYVHRRFELLLINNPAVCGMPPGFFFGGPFNLPFVMPVWHSQLLPDDHASFERFVSAPRPTNRPVFVRVGAGLCIGLTVYTPKWSVLVHPVYGDSLPYIEYIQHWWPIGTVIDHWDGVTVERIKIPSDVVPGLYEVVCLDEPYTVLEQVPQPQTLI